MPPTMMWWGASVHLYTVRMKRLVIPVAALLLLAGCSAPQQSPVAAETPLPSAEVDYSSLPKEIPGNGSFVVGVDLQPGTYEEETATGSCKWYKGENGELTASGDGPLMTAEAGETLEVEGCSVIVRIGDLAG